MLAWTGHRLAVLSSPDVDYGPEVPCDQAPLSAQRRCVWSIGAIAAKMISMCICFLYYRLFIFILLEEDINNHWARVAEWSKAPDSRQRLPLQRDECSGPLSWAGVRTPFLASHIPFLSIALFEYCPFWVLPFLSIALFEYCPLWVLPSGVPWR